MNLTKLLLAISIYFLLPLLSYSQEYNYTELKSLPAKYKLGIHSAVFSPDGKYLASSSKNALLKIWDISTGKCIHKFRVNAKGIQSIAFSPDGKYVAGSSSGKLKIWDISTGKRIHKFKADTNALNLITFSPDGKCLFSDSFAYVDAHNYYNDNSSVNALKIWDISTGKCMRTFTNFVFDSTVYYVRISSVAYSHDGKYLAAQVDKRGTRDACLDYGDFSEIKLWDMITGQCIRVFTKPKYNRDYGLAFSPDGKYLASGSDDKTEVWEISTGLNVCTLPTINDYLFNKSFRAFSPDSKYLAVSNRYSIYNTLNLWDISTGEDISTFKQLKGNSFIAFSPDWKYMASFYQEDRGSSRYSIQIWERNK